MHEADHLSARERAERPTARAPRDNQVTARRDFQIGQRKRLALQRDARIKLLNRRTFTDLNFSLRCALLC